MKITFDTKNAEEVAEVLAYLLGTSGKANNVTETPLEAPKKEKTTPSIPRAKKPVEAPAEQKAKKSKITIDEVKDVAKNAVGRTDRELVKNTITPYGNKLAEVKETDYEELIAKLNSLGV